MKAVLFNGSSRKEGNTYYSLNIVKDELEKETEWESLEVEDEFEEDIKTKDISNGWETPEDHPESLEKINVFKNIKSIDDILFNRVQDQKKYEYERIELEDDIPELVPRSPMPRFKRVTLQELMDSLNKAIITENRRIKKEIVNRNAIRESSISLPKKTISIRDRIREIFDMLTGHFRENEDHTKIAYSVFVGLEKEKRIEYFAPLLHLENQKKKVDEEIEKKYPSPPKKEVKIKGPLRYIFRRVSTNKIRLFCA